MTGFYSETPAASEGNTAAPTSNFKGSAAYENITDPAPLADAAAASAAAAATSAANAAASATGVTSSVTAAAASATAAAGSASAASTSASAASTSASAASTSASAAATSATAAAGSATSAAASATSAASLNFGIAPAGRLTLTSGVAQPQTDVAGSNIVYFTPVNGAVLSLYNGTSWSPRRLTEISNILSASSSGNAGPAAVAASSVYDLFVWDNGGTTTLTRGPAWSSATARPTGSGTSELVIVDGIPMNKFAITNGPAASRGIFVGTLRSNGSSLVDFTFGTTIALGGPASFGVWNQWNPLPFKAKVGDSTASWSYTTAATRAANGSTNNRISFVSGQPVFPINVNRGYWMNPAAVAGAFAFSGYGMDDATTFLNSNLFTLQAAVSVSDAKYVGGTIPAQVGWHDIYALERGDNANATTYSMSAQGRYLEAILWQ